MAKLGKRNIGVRSDIDYTQQISFDVEINVSKDGEFYFTLNEEQKERLLNLGVDLSSTFNHRTKKTGTFYNTSLDKLISNFKALISDAISAEILEDRFVILYRISTSCSYTMSDGVPVPSGIYCKATDKNEKGCITWYEGDDGGDTGFGFNVYAKIFHKQVLKFKSGQVKTFYWYINHIELEKLGEYGKRLNHFTIRAADIKDPYGSNSRYSMQGKLEIDYNEENAKFFHDLLLSVCKLNEKIKDFVKEPEKMQAIISSSTKLLT